jgi:hypothetical protein
MVVFSKFLRRTMMKSYQHLIAILLTASVATPLLANAADNGTSSSDTTASQKNRNETSGTTGKALNTDPSGRYKDRRADDTSAAGDTNSNNTDTTAAAKKNRNETSGTSGKALNTDPSGRYKDRRADDTATTSGSSDQH